MLVVPGVNVPTVPVQLPARFKVPAPPLIVRTLLAVAPATKTRSPEIDNVPVVIIMVFILPALVAVPANVTDPETVAVPAFIYKAFIELPLARFIVIFPLTFNTEAAALKVKLLAVLFDELPIAIEAQLAVYPVGIVTALAAAASPIKTISPATGQNPALTEPPPEVKDHVVFTFHAVFATA